mmetsp:Transcript_14768/g.30278  ORF Transcript_14768/g.30278 Transcript_14768/m.30278 type:complete len:102 (-) Transcript_14768:230-535(-)
MALAPATKDTRRRVATVDIRRVLMPVMPSFPVTNLPKGHSRGPVDVDDQANSYFELVHCERDESTVLHLREGSEGEGRRRGHGRRQRPRGSCFRRPEWGDK